MGKITEIERCFLIHDSDHLKKLKKTLLSLGFKLAYSASQLNYYLDFPNFLLFNNKQDFRFRYNFIIFFDRYQHIERIGKFKDGEISLSTRFFDDDTENEMRDQISIKITERQQLESLFELMGKVGFVNSYFLCKNRETYSYSGKLPENNKIHFEIDTNIDIAKYPKTEDFYKLQDTFQICIELANRKQYDNEKFNRFMKILGFTPNEIIKSRNYMDRMEEKLKDTKGEGQI